MVTEEPLVRFDAFVRFLRSGFPDPLAIALGLTFVTFLAAWGLGDASAGALLDAWGGPKGLWSLLAFAMQMCLILVTGYVVASTRPVRWAIGLVASIPRNTGQAAALISVIAMGLALLNWGLGLIGGALLAREVGIAMRERGRAVHYPLLAAAGYTGLAVWHGGFSGSAPLKVTEAKDLVEVLGSELAAAVGPIPLGRTLLSEHNLATSLVVLVVVPLVLMAMAPSDPEGFQAPPERPPEQSGPPPAPGFAGLVENGPWLVVPVALMAVAWLWSWLRAGGLAGLDPNEVNLVFLVVGLALAASPGRYAVLSEPAARACAGIIVQFPLYGGITALLVTSGLLADLAGLLPRGEGLPIATFTSAALVNLLIPSGGGQWSVQGPIVMQAAVDANVDPARVVMALAYGDQVTNLLQPFWALPLLGITGTRVGDIIGYTAILCGVLCAVFALSVLLG